MISPLKLAKMLLVGGLALAATPAMAENQAPEGENSPAEAAKATYEFPKPAQSRVIGMEEALRIPKTHGSDLLIVNYWATWCGPCVEELPYFIRLSKEYKVENVRFIGYSLDFVEEIEGTVDPFLKEKGVPYANLVLEVDPNVYVEKVYENWRGNVPATFFYDREGNLVGKVLDQINYDDLDKLTSEILEKIGVKAEKIEVTEEVASSPD